MRETFEKLFRQLGAMMLRALERRRDRVFARAAGLQPEVLSRPLTGAEMISRDGRTCTTYYASAYNSVHGAMLFVHYA